MWSAARVDADGRDPRVVVSYRRVILETTRGSAHAGRLRARDISHGWYGLSVAHATLIRNLTIPRFEPQPDRQFGWGVSPALLSTSICWPTS